MSESVPPKQILDARALDAAIFDLDGVVTQTAQVHAQCWKRLFDEVLRQRSDEAGEPFRPFDEEADYLGFVDGKPRFDGVRDFLRSRGIKLPEGEPTDEPEKATVFGLGKRKNLYFREHLEREGVAVFDSTIALLHQLRRMKVKLALASSSRNAEPVLAAAKLTDLFDVRVDGNDLGRLGLKGKPAPDLFLLAAKQLDVSPSRAVVFEDAISGVAAGRAGDFAHVVGVDRAGTPEALRKSGADIVVPDLAFLEIQGGPS
jgi:alpha,alpha-trehalase